MKKKEILVSIIVPALNEEKFIVNCLKSLNNQTVPRENYELIVSDSSSVDKTVSLAKKFADKVVVCKRLSAGFGRNYGAKYAKGKFLAFADADTVVSKTWLEGIIQAFEEKRNAACTGPVYPIEKDSFSHRAAFFFWQLLTRFSVLVNHGLMPGHNMAVRKSIFKELNGFLEGNITNEDNEFSRRVKKKGRIVFSEKMNVCTSTRRLKKISMINYFLNGVKFFLFGKSMTWNDFREDY